MWHEQRKEEKRIRGMLVDRRRRAERRKDYYQKIKADPNQFLQIHGRSVKIHLEPSVALAADSPANMMPWPGDSKILIDRFDGRANLDIIPEFNSKTTKQELSVEENKELRITNYERYKILIQNQYLNVSEDKFLHTIELEEKYGGTTYQGKKAKDEKKMLAGSKAAIGFIYEDSAEPLNEDYEEEEESDLDSDEDFDLNLDVTSLNAMQVGEINKVGHNFGLERKDVFKFLTKDYEEQEEIKSSRAKESEKASASGKKSKRRRNNRDRYHEGKISPNYALKKETSKSKSRSRSSSRSSKSASEAGDEKIEFITSFGGDSDQEKTKLDHENEMPKSYRSSKKIGPALPKRSRNRRRSRSRSRDKRRRRSRSRRSRSRDDWVRKRHSRRSRSRSKSRPSKRSSRSISKERSRIEKRLNRAFSPPPKPAVPVKSRVATDSSSSSDSEDNQDNANRYRSKYRNKKADSDTSEEDVGDKDGNAVKDNSNANEDNKGRTEDSLYHHSLSRFFSGIQDKAEDTKEEEKVVQTIIEPQPEPPPVKRYYGRKKADESESEISVDSESSDGEQPGAVWSRNGKDSSKGPSNKKEEALSIKEKLKKKMLQQIKRTFKEDKKVEKERLRKQTEEQLVRDEELWELGEKLRLKDRERRRLERRENSDSADDRSRSRSRRRSLSPEERRRKRSRSKSRERRKRSRSRESSRRRKRRSGSRSKSKSKSRSRRRSRSRENKKTRRDSSREKLKLVDY